MSDKKHIDRIFQEKLKDFEATPDNTVWKNISSQLKNDKKDRKIIPFWWKFAGVAASLLLILTVGNFMLNDSNETTNTNKVSTATEEIKKVETTKEIIPVKENKSTNSQIDPKHKINESLANEKKLNEDVNQTKDNFNVKNETPLVKSSESKTTKNSQNIQSRRNLFQKDEVSNKGIANNPQDKSNFVLEKQNETTLNGNKDINPNQNPYTEKVVEINSDNLELIKEKATEIIAESKLKDTILIEKEKLPLTEEVIVINEDINEEEKETINRWQINPNFAPVYFSNFGNGSSIDNQFIDNEKSGKINISYGIAAGYSLNDRITIKSGINKLKLGYDTKGVITIDGMAANSNSNYYRNIKFANSSNVMFLSANNVSLAQTPDVFSTTLKSALNQEIEYIEVPLELKYNISSKNKLGVNVIGGASLLLLTDNNVFAVVNGEKTLIGVATNLNSASYSANFGLGLDYNISKNINLNIDPMFKYQFNTYNTTSGDFKPYFIGVYSGINVKF